MKVSNYGIGFITALFCLTATATASAADLDRAEVESRLAKADKNHPADLRRKELTDIDLSGLNFTQADLWGSDLRRSNFSHSIRLKFRLIRLI